MRHEAMTATAEGKRLKSADLALKGTDPGAPTHIGFTCKKKTHLRYFRNMKAMIF